MKKPSCIRGLQEFKKGCPQKTWDGEEGCSGWIEMSVSKRGNPQEKEIRKQCIDLWTWEFQWATLGLLEGNQEAIESFRNGMVAEGPDGEVRPKSDLGTVSLINIIQSLQRQKAIEVPP